MENSVLTSANISDKLLDYVQQRIKNYGLNEPNQGVKSLVDVLGSNQSRRGDTWDSYVDKLVKTVDLKDLQAWSDDLSSLLEKNTGEDHAEPPINMIDIWTTLVKSRADAQAIIDNLIDKDTINKFKSQNATLRMKIKKTKLREQLKALIERFEALTSGNPLLMAEFELKLKEIEFEHWQKLDLLVDTMKARMKLEDEAE